MHIYPDLDDTDTLSIFTGCRRNMFAVMSRWCRSAGVTKTF